MPGGQLVTVVYGRGMASDMVWVLAGRRSEI